MASPIVLSYDWKKSINIQNETITSESGDITYQLNTNPSPLVVSVSLFDLLFYETTDLNVTNIKTRFNVLNPPLSVPYKFPHSEILINTLHYQSSDLGHRQIIPNSNENIPVSGSTTFLEFQTFGFDLANAFFDTRSKPLFLTIDNYSSYIQNATDNNFNTILGLINPPTYPIDANHPNYPFQGQGLSLWDKNSIQKYYDSFDFYTHSLYYAGEANRESVMANTWNDYLIDYTLNVALDSDKELNCDCLLIDEDLEFENRFIIPYLKEGTENNFRIYSGLCFTSNSAYVLQMLIKYFGGTGEVSSATLSNWYNINNTTNIVTINPVLVFLLKNVYVYLKFPIVGDSIDIEDFNQNLNEESDVTHKNILLTESGNLDRFEPFYTTNNTAPSFQHGLNYVSKIPPSVDLIGPFLKSDLYANINNMSTSNFVQNIIVDANNPNSKIGSIPIGPFETLGQTDTDYNEINPPPPTYFDPESRRTSNAYNDIPILTPKNGNLEIEGRILSPTIDELWKIIKKLIAGRNNDSSTKPDGGYPTGNATSKQINIDTRPSIKHHNLPNSKIGDPLNIEYDESSLSQFIYTVTEWVNDPDTINYQKLDDVSTFLTILQNVYDLSPSEYPNNNDPNNRYIPNDTPLSLRELEGCLKGLRWNLSYLLSLLIKNNAFGGNTSPINKGTLYQLHKSYGGYVNANSYYGNVNSLGTMNVPESINDYPDWTAYLGADGEYHSIWQATRLPILDEEF